MWKYLRGYVILQVQGLRLERFLRRLLLSGVWVSDIRRLDETTAELTILARDMRRLLPIRRRERCRIRIVKKAGFPFRLRVMRAHPALLFGLPLCVALLWLWGTRIWRIRVEGTDRVDPAEVLALLAEHGLSVGKRPKGSVLITAADDLSARLCDAAWVELHKDGVILTVTVEESLPRTEPVDWSVPANLVAVKDGTVAKVVTRRGKPEVREGQTVRKGDVLIGGHVVYAEDRTAYDTHADGEVLACCVYTAEADLPETVTEYVDTDRVSFARTLSVAGVPLLHREPDFPSQREGETSAAEIARFGIPIALTKTERFETEQRERILTDGERIERAKLTATEAAITSVPHDAKICSIHAVVLQKDGKRFVRCTVVTEESIGITKEYQP